MLNIENPSRGEKLRMMEAIWNDLTHNTVMMSPAEWHEDELKKSEHVYQEKRAEMASWEIAKKVLRDKSAILAPNKFFQLNGRLL